MKYTVSVYNSIAERYDKLFGGRNKFIDSFARMLPKKARILDAGCGTGGDTAFLVSKGFSVESVDASKKMIGIARKKLPKHKFHLANISKINYPKNSFDGIVAAFSLIHLRKRDSKNTIKKFQASLKKNGLIYIALQEGEGEKVIKEPLDNKRKIFINFYTLSEIKKILEPPGFKIIFAKKVSAKNRHEFRNNKVFIIAMKV